MTPPPPTAAQEVAPPTTEQLRSAIAVLKRANYRVIEEQGYHFRPVHFYCALNDCRFLDENRDLWDRFVDPPGIDLDLDRQMTTAREAARAVHELRDVPVEPTGNPAEYYWTNPFWCRADAMVQYGLVRSRQPARYIEVGCGWSSLLLAKALAKNDKPCQVTLIEPHPRRNLLATLPEDWSIQECILQRAPLDLFESLQAGDFLFFDGSHCAKTASDVNWLMFEVLPRLNPGVIVHFHDIHWPQDYPAIRYFEQGHAWNEQYVVQAFLMHNSDYRVLIANNHLFVNRREELDTLYQGIQIPRGCSIWLEKISK